MCFDFTKMAPNIKVQTLIFLWRSCFYLVLFGQVRGIWASLEEIWANMLLEVLSFEKMHPT